MRSRLIPWAALLAVACGTPVRPAPNPVGVAPGDSGTATTVADPSDSGGTPLPPTELYVGRQEAKSSKLTTRIITYRTMWEAVAALDERFANVLARTPDEKRFARALAAQLDGDLATAQREYGDLAHSAVDSLVRRRSVMALVAALQEQDDWAGLVAAAHDTAIRPIASTADRAGVLAWAEAFTNAPPQGFLVPKGGVRAGLVTNPLHAASIEVEIHGKRYEFWLDTGSTFTLIAADIAHDLGIEPLGGDSLLLATAAGRIGAHAAVLDSFRVADMRNGGRGEERFLRVTNQRVALVSERDLRLLPHVAGVVPPIRVAGVLGSAFLRHMDIRLDMPAGYVTFLPPGARAHGVARTLHWVGYPVIRVPSITGTPLLFGVDLGADTSYATTTSLEKFPGATGRGPSTTMGGFGSAKRTSSVTLLNLTITVGDRELRFRNLFVDLARPAGIALLDGILGRDVAIKFPVRIDLGAGVFGPL